MMAVRPIVNKILHIIFHELFQNRWLGRRGYTAYTLAGPFTIFDTFRLFSVKETKRLFPQGHPTTPDDMKRRITAAYAEISAEILERVHQFFYTRLEGCFETGGYHFKHKL